MARLRAPVLAAALAAVLVAVPATHGSEPPRVGGSADVPVLDADFPDPDVVRVGSTYYAYATESAAMAAAGGATVQRARSTDLHTWTLLPGGALTLPAWAEPGRTWAPEVFQRGDGRLVMWFTAHHRASGRQCIGVALADDPESRFVPVDDEQPAICPVADGGAIDAASFADGSQRYILWKTDGNCCDLDTWIMIRPVAPDGVTLTGRASPLIRQDQDVEGGLVEAPTMWRTGDTYVLLYSANEYGGPRYLTAYARSSRPTAGFVKGPAPLLTTTALGGRVVGPGGQDVVARPDGRTVLVHHGWREDLSYRALYVRELGFADGHPRVAVGEPVGDLSPG